MYWEKIKKIAIIRRNGLGDLLSVLPLIGLCKKRAPDARVVLFIDPRAAPRVPYLKGPDEVVVVEDKNKYIGLFKAVRKQAPFDLAISAKPSPMKLMNFFLYASLAPHRAAYVDDSWHCRWVNHGRPFHPQAQIHQVLKCLHLINPALTEIPEELYPRFDLAVGGRGEIPTIFTSVTNNRIGSRLSPENYARPLNGLFCKKNFSVVINCEPKDKVSAEKLGAMLKMPYQIVATPTFDEFMHLLSSCDAAFIGDGGIMHLAAALDKPQVVLFGGTKIWEWAPLSKKAICLGHLHNVNDIDQDQVLEELGKII